ncbi:retrovirus-related Pol polyprotein from transposon 412 [Trichonephila clavipes]|nr:retrovirus-related Pol polyprotein from transposon 412 [Trichonephila clavipes]
MGHLRRNWPRARKEENTVSSSKQENYYMAISRGGGCQIMKSPITQNPSDYRRRPCGDKGLYVIGQINNISCRMFDTGANVSIIRKDLAQNSKLSIIWTPPCVSLQTVTGDKIQVHGKANVTLRTEYIIPGLVAENRKFRFGLIDYPDPDNSKGVLLIASLAVDFSKSVIPVRVANISDKTRTIQEGEVTAACAPVTCVDRNCNSQDHSSDDLVKNLLQNIDLDKKQRCAARELITGFQSVFSRTSEDFGRTRLTKH